MKRIIVFIFFLFSFNDVFSIEVDKLLIEPELSKVFMNSGEFKKYYDEGTEFLADNPNKAYRIALDLQRLAFKTNKIELIFLADYFLARCYYFFNDGAKAIKVFQVVMKMAEKYKWIDAQIKVNTYLAAIFSNKKNYVLTEKHYERGLQMALKYKRTNFQLHLFERLGFMNVVLDKPGADAKGMNYFKSGLELAKTLKDTAQMAVFYSRIGLLGNDGEPNDSSIALIHYSLGLLLKAKKYDHLMLAYKSLGDSYYTMGLNDSSLFYYMKVYLLHRQIGQARVAAISSCDVAYMYGTLGKTELLSKYADTAIAFAKKDRSGEARFYVYKWLADIYNKISDFKIANKYYKLHTFLLDSTLKSGGGEALTSVGLQSDFDSQLELIRLKQVREREIRNKEKEEQAFRSRIYLIGFFIVLIFLIIIFREFRINRKQKRIISQQHKDVSSQKLVLEIKNKEITDSINYAKRIQDSQLPSEKYIERNLEKLRKGK